MKHKKLLAAALCGAMVLGSAVTVSAAETPEPVVTYDFESDHGIELFGEAAVVANPDDEADQVLLIEDGPGTYAGGNYGLLPEGTLSGYDFSEGITVSMDLRPTLNGSGWNYIFCIGASGTATDVSASGYAYVDGTIGLTVRYGDDYEAIGAYGHFADGNSIEDNEDFFLKDGAQDRWYNFTFVYSPDEISIYVNGQLQVQSTPQYASSMSKILSGLDEEAAIVFGAGASRGDLENFGGYMDDVRIYEGALDADSVSSIVDADAYEGIPVFETEEDEADDADAEEAEDADAAKEAEDADAAKEAENADAAEETQESSSALRVVLMVIAGILVVLILVLAIVYSSGKMKMSRNNFMIAVVVLAVVAVILVVIGTAAGGSSSEDEAAATESGVGESADSSDWAPSTDLVEVYDVARLQIERDGVADGEVALPVSAYQNPLGGYDDAGEITYGGDPSVLVDGDTVYVYTGHDVSTVNAYNIPEYLCWSTTDLCNWTYEGVAMTADKETISWASSSTDAWASQVAKHYDQEAGKDMYYLYFCTWDKTSDGKQSIGVATSENPAGPFVDIGEPLISGNLTASDETSTWNDIDPTVWIEHDEDGVEHRYLAWGNGQYYICELNEDMVSVKDLNGDGQVTTGTSQKDGDIITGLTSGLTNYTEGPYLYRRSDEYGNYYGDYYLFYACGWPESLAYTTTSDLLGEKWGASKTIFVASATSNTNHPAVFDFKGHTYMITHNGMLPGGSGYRRTPVIMEITFDEDGSIEKMTETASGVSGVVSQITLADGRAIGHEYLQSNADSDRYPYVDIACGYYEDPDPDWEGDYEDEDLQWVIMAGLSDPDNAAYVCIQSENRPGLFITANEDLTVTAAQEYEISDDVETAQTFRTIKGLSDADGVTFESVAYPGYYLTMVGDVLGLTDGSDAENATFYVSTVE